MEGCMGGADHRICSCHRLGGYKLTEWTGEIDQNKASEDCVGAHQNLPQPLIAGKELPRLSRIRWAYFSSTYTGRMHAITLFEQPLRCYLASGRNAQWRDGVLKVYSFVRPANLGEEIWQSSSTYHNIFVNLISLQFWSHVLSFVCCFVLSSQPIIVVFLVFIS